MIDTAQANPMVAVDLMRLDFLVLIFRVMRRRSTVTAGRNFDQPERLAIAYQVHVILSAISDSPSRHVFEIERTEAILLLERAVMTTSMWSYRYGIYDIFQSCLFHILCNRSRTYDQETV